MDTIDTELVRLLQKDGRASWADLAASVRLTPPAVADRVHRLREAGVIRGFTAHLDPAAVGLPLLSFVAVSLGNPKHRTGFLEVILGEPAILECHHVAGDDDFLLKVRTAGVAELDRLLSTTLKRIDGVVRSRTTIALGTVKDTTALPLPHRKKEKKGGGRE
jgi:Lrp/AsnC family leucine-responsive transcriptional regulator